MSFQIDFGGEKSPIVGIDLGTTNSLVAVMELTGPRILSGIVPSVVSVTEAGDFIAGADARELLLTHPDRTVYSVKRLMGARHRGYSGRTQTVSLSHRRRQPVHYQIEAGREDVHAS